MSTSTYIVLMAACLIAYVFCLLTMVIVWP